MIEKIKKIREKTGAGVIDIKKALKDAEGDEVKAIEIIKKRGLEKADRKEGRQTREGTIGFYIHTDFKSAAFVKVYCETDFVAKNEEFRELAKDLAMQIVAMDPLTLKPEDITNEEIQNQKDFWQKELEAENKPKEILEKIMEGKENKFRKEHSLFGQEFIKNQEITVEEYVKQKIAKIGENIKVGEFKRVVL